MTMADPDDAPTGPEGQDQDEIASQPDHNTDTEESGAGYGNHGDAGYPDPDQAAPSGG